MKTLLSFASAALLAAAIPTFAQDKQAPPKQGPEQVFAALDTNKDQKLSEAEMGRLFANAKDDERKQAFAQWDADKDGSVSIQEFSANYRGQDNK